MYMCILYTFSSLFLFCSFLLLYQTGDGNIDVEDVKVWWRKVRDLLTNKLPDAAGFSLGFLCGVKYG
jgi:hypothetical protein